MQKKIIFLIPFLTGFNGITLKVGGYNARIDQVLSVVIFVLLLLQYIFTGRRIFIDKPSIYLTLFLFYSLIVTVIFAPDLNYSFMQTINIITVALIFFSICNIIRDDKQLSTFSRYFIWAGILHCTSGVLLFILSLIGLINYGAYLVDDPTMPYGAYGTMVEPNIYGGYCLGYFIFSSIIVFTTKLTKKLLYYLLCISFVGLFLSFTRGAWVAAVIGLIFAIIFIKRLQKINLKRIISFVVIVVCLYFAVSSIISESFLLFKLTNIVESETGTGAYRLLIWNIALENIKTNPIFGTGTYSFATITGDGTYEPHTNLWIGNTYITLLHDYGLVGLILYGIFLLLLIGGSIKLIKKYYNKIEQEDRTILLALNFAVISLYIAYFFTMGNSLAYSWLYLGLINIYKRKIEINMCIKKV